MNEGKVDFDTLIWNLITSQGAYCLKILSDINPSLPHSFFLPCIVCWYNIISRVQWTPQRVKFARENDVGLVLGACG